MVAFLLSLANMAVRTSQFSLADRRTMFAILRPVELRMCAFVTGRKDDWDFMVWAPLWARHDDSPEDALRLAAAFRTMAFALAYILTRYRRFWNRSAAQPNDNFHSVDQSEYGVVLPPHRQILAINRQPAIQYFDTS